MKILVANIGSTSFKYRLFDMDGERQLARGGIERIGSAESLCTVEIGDAKQEKVLSAEFFNCLLRERARHHCVPDINNV